jgi:hypothetical protein
LSAIGYNSLAVLYGCEWLITIATNKNVVLVVNKNFKMGQLTSGVGVDLGLVVFGCVVWCQGLKTFMLCH